MAVFHRKMAKNIRFSSKMAINSRFSSKIGQQLSKRPAYPQVGRPVALYVTVRKKSDENNEKSTVLRTVDFSLFSSDFLLTLAF